MTTRASVVTLGLVTLVVTAAVAAQQSGSTISPGHGIASETLAAELKAAGFEPVASESGARRWFMVVVGRPKF